MKTPKDWQRPDARRYMLLVRLHKGEKKALLKLSKKRKHQSVSETIRWLLYKALPPEKW